MTTQEEIRERIKDLLLPDKYTIEYEWGNCDKDGAIEDAYGAADDILSYLHSQGVVIKGGEVDNETPVEAFEVEPLIKE